jgi:hypothetical protein
VGVCKHEQVEVTVSVGVRPLGQLELGRLPEFVQVRYYDCSYLTSWRAGGESGGEPALACQG